MKFKKNSQKTEVPKGEILVGVEKEENYAGGERRKWSNYPGQIKNHHRKRVTKTNKNNSDKTRFVLPFRTLFEELFSREGI